MTMLFTENLSRAADTDAPIEKRDSLLEMSERGSEGESELEDEFYENWFDQSDIKVRRRRKKNGGRSESERCRWFLGLGCIPGLCRQQSQRLHADEEIVADDKSKFLIVKRELSSDRFSGQCCISLVSTNLGFLYVGVFLLPYPFVAARFFSVIIDYILFFPLFFFFLFLGRFSVRMQPSNLYRNEFAANLQQVEKKFFSFFFLYCSQLVLYRYPQLPCISYSRLLGTGRPDEHRHGNYSKVRRKKIFFLFRQNYLVMKKEVKKNHKIVGANERKKER